MTRNESHFLSFVFFRNFCVFSHASLLIPFHTKKHERTRESLERKEETTTTTTLTRKRMNSTPLPPSSREYVFLLLLLLCLLYSIKRIIEFFESFISLLFPIERDATRMNELCERTNYYYYYYYYYYEKQQKYQRRFDRRGRYHANHCVPNARWC